MSHELHRRQGPKTARFYIVTVSTSRYREKAAGGSPSDESGDTAERSTRPLSGRTCAVPRPVP